METAVLGFIYSSPEGVLYDVTARCSLVVGFSSNQDSQKSIIIKGQIRVL